MLVLSRRLGETLIIGDNIKITVLGIKGNQVRFGVDAPKSIAVHREEIYQRIQEQGGNSSKNLTAPRPSATPAAAPAYPATAF